MLSLRLLINQLEIHKPSNYITFNDLDSATSNHNLNQGSKKTTAIALIAVIIIPIPAATLGFYLVTTPNTFEAASQNLKNAIIATSSLLLSCSAAKVFSDIAISRSFAKINVRNSDKQPFSIREALCICFINVIPVMASAACGMYWLSQHLRLDPIAFNQVTQYHKNLELAFGILWVLTLIALSAIRSIDLLFIFVAFSKQRAHNKFHNRVPSIPREDEKQNHFMRYWSHRRHMSNKSVSLQTKSNLEKNQDSKTQKKNAAKVKNMTFFNILSPFARSKISSAGKKNNCGYLDNNDTKFPRYQYPAPGYRYPSELMVSNISRDSQQQDQLPQTSSKYSTTAEFPNDTIEMGLGQFQTKNNDTDETKENDSSSFENDTKVGENDNGTLIEKSNGIFGGTWFKVKCIFLSSKSHLHLEENTNSYQKGTTEPINNDRPQIIDVGIQRSFSLQKLQNISTSHSFHHNTANEFINYKQIKSKKLFNHNEPPTQPQPNPSLNESLESSGSKNDQNQNDSNNEINFSNHSLHHIDGINNFLSSSNTADINSSSARLERALQNKTAFDEWDFSSESVQNRYIGTMPGTTSEPCLLHPLDPNHRCCHQQHSVPTLSDYADRFSFQSSTPHLNYSGFVSGTDTPTMSSSSFITQSTPGSHFFSETHLGQQQQYIPRTGLLAPPPSIKVSPPRSPATKSARQSVASIEEEDDNLQQCSYSSSSLSSRQMQQPHDYLGRLSVPSTPPLVVHKRSTSSLPISELSLADPTVLSAQVQQRLHRHGNKVDDRYDRPLDHQHPMMEQDQLAFNNISYSPVIRMEPSLASQRASILSTASMRSSFVSENISPPIVDNGDYDNVIMSDNTQSPRRSTEDRPTSTPSVLFNVPGNSGNDTLLPTVPEAFKRLPRPKLPARHHNHRYSMEDFKAPKTLGSRYSMENLKTSINL